METRLRVLGLAPLETLNSINFVAGVLNAQGKYGMTEHMHRRLLDQCKEELGLEHPMTAAMRINLVMTLDKQGKHEAAREIRRQALELARKVGTSWS